jgi:hypothetical protein
MLQAEYKAEVMPSVVLCFTSHIFIYNFKLKFNDSDTFLILFLKNKMFFFYECAFNTLHSKFNILPSDSCKIYFLHRRVYPQVSGLR